MCIDFSLELYDSWASAVGYHLVNMVLHAIVSALYLRYVENENE